MIGHNDIQTLLKEEHHLQSSTPQPTPRVFNPKEKEEEKDGKNAVQLLKQSFLFSLCASLNSYGGLTLPSAKATANMFLGDHENTILHDIFRWVGWDAKAVKACVRRG